MSEWEVELFTKLIKMGKRTSFLLLLFCLFIFFFCLADWLVHGGGWIKVSEFHLKVNFKKAVKHPSADLGSSYIFKSGVHRRCPGWCTF
jgi:hypothetical protein